MSVDDAFHESALLVSIGIVITCLEVYAIRAHYGRSGLLSWDVVRLSYRWTIRGTVAMILGVIFCPFGFLCLNTVRLSAAICVILVSTKVLENHLVELTSLVMIFILTGLFHFRNLLGLDGSDQMTLILCTVLMLRAFAPDSPLVSLTCLGFATLQAALAYATAGWSKIIARQWRSGMALTGIMNTTAYGSKHLAKVLFRCSPLAVVISWTIIAFEISFPAAFLLGNYCWIFLAGGVAFHAVTACIMGLNNFFWAFVATYPLIYFASVQLATCWTR